MAPGTNRRWRGTGRRNACDHFGLLSARLRSQAWISDKCCRPSATLMRCVTFAIVERKDPIGLTRLVSSSLTQSCNHPLWERPRRLRPSIMANCAGARIYPCRTGGLVRWPLLRSLGGSRLTVFLFIAGFQKVGGLEPRPCHLNEDCAFPIRTRRARPVHAFVRVSSIVPVIFGRRHDTLTLVEAPLSA